MIFNSRVTFIPDFPSTFFRETQKTENSENRYDIDLDLVKFLADRNTGVNGGEY